MINKVSRNKDRTLRKMGKDKQIPHDIKSHSLLEWHIRLGHMLFKRIQALATIRKATKKVLAKCKVPFCTGYFYGRLTRQPWRHKGEQMHIADKVARPGE
jgi:hypothetical protein